MKKNFFSNGGMFFILWWTIPLILLHYTDKFLSPHWIWYLKENVLGWIAFVWSLLGIFIFMYGSAFFDRRKQKKEAEKEILRIFIDMRDKITKFFIEKNKLN